MALPGTSADHQDRSVTPSDLPTILEQLTAGAARWAAIDPRSRAEIARRTACATVAVARAWADAAVEVKQAPGNGPSRAEEIATGPMGTARLCLLTARSLLDIDRSGTPGTASPPRVLHPGRRSVAGTPAPLIGLDVLPARGPSGTLYDPLIHGGLRATIRCHDPGGPAAFLKSWQHEADQRPRGGGVSLVLGAGNVTGLGPADVLCQVFEHGRAALLKLHPLQSSLETVFTVALAPLIEAGLVAILSGGADVASSAIAAPQLTHVHVTGGRATYEAILFGGPRPSGPAPQPRLTQSISCELGNVTPWFILPGRYSTAELAFQADQLAASIINNTSFNCIATKVIVTCRSWEQRQAFLGLVQRRLASLPPRPGWYPGAAAVWSEATGHASPADGTLPWSVVCGVDPARDGRLLEREWFVPVVAEVPLDAGTLAEFCSRALGLSHRLPGSLAASVTIPSGLPETARLHAEQLVDHLAFGVVAVNTWSALAYSLGKVPWGGFPGATMLEPKSGIGFVHDPLLLPLVHNSVIRAPLWSALRPPWFAWHRSGTRLAQGVVDLYGRCAAGQNCLGILLRMFPEVLRG